MYLPLAPDEFDANQAPRHKRRRPHSLDLATQHNLMSRADSISAEVREIQPKETSLASVPDTLLSDEGETVRKRPTSRQATSSGKTKDSKLKVMSDNEGERTVGQTVHKTKKVMSHDYIRRFKLLFLAACVVPLTCFVDDTASAMRRSGGMSRS